jgi:hypothetical protein
MRLMRLMLWLLCVCVCINTLSERLFPLPYIPLSSPFHFTLVTIIEAHHSPLASERSGAIQSAAAASRRRSWLETGRPVN